MALGQPSQEQGRVAAADAAVVVVVSGDRAAVGVEPSWSPECRRL